MPDKKINWEKWGVFVSIILSIIAIHYSSLTFRLERGPNISFHDVLWSVIDKTGTEIKSASWREGEKLNHGAVYSVPKEIILSSVLTNTGKKVGAVELVELYVDGEKRGIIGDAVSGTRFIVPANSTSGPLLGADIYPYLKDGVKKIDLGLILQTYKPDNSTSEKIEIVIRCSSLKDSIGLLNIDCYPVQKQLNNKI